MFWIACQRCKQRICIKQYPSSSEIPCPACGYIHVLKPLEHYFPKFIGLQGEDAGKEFSIDRKATLGRSTSNMIHIREKKASRMHAVIEFKSDHYMLEDLKSGNGTLLNGKPVTQSVALKDKDKITIGDAIFCFSNPYNYSSNSTHQSPGVVSSEPSMFEKTKAEFSFNRKHSFLMPAEEQIQNLIDLGKANSKLRILYEVTHTISSVFELEPLLAKILSVVFQYIPADRGAILLYEESIQKFTLQVVKERNKSEESNIQISRMILDRVVSKRVSLLTTDALLDDTLSDSQTLQNDGVRSAMGVPLIYQETLLGVLYIDSTEPLAEFNEDTLELLSGIATQAAMTIANAKLLYTLHKEMETRSFLEKYLSPELVEQIVNEQIHVNVGGDLTNATILFTDIRDFTKLTEHIGAQAVVTVLNDYFSRMVDIIFDHHGTLDKFIGDAIMGLWGVPVGRIDDTFHAIAAALEMQNELFYFNLSQKKKGRPMLKIGAGINWGEVVAGNIGSSKRMEYTVIGPSVNLASRVESLTGKNQVFISDNVYEQVKEIACVVPFKSTHVKGVERAISIYGVIGIKDVKLKQIYYFLPILIWNQKTKTYSLEGLIRSFDLQSAQIDIDPVADIELGENIHFIIDIPELAPKEDIQACCLSIQHLIHENATQTVDEFSRWDVNFTVMSESVKSFLLHLINLRKKNTATEKIL